MFLSVIIPTYNPDIGMLTQTLNALKEQTLPLGSWELIIIDNNSSFNIADKVDLTWMPDISVITEPRQGLTHARMKGFSETEGNLIVLVDDDNILAKDYLKVTLDIFTNHPLLGAAGGKSIPVFNCQEPGWLKEFYGNLALRDLGNDVIINSWNFEYPAASPVGAGMAVRRAALEGYISKISAQAGPITDRTAGSLSSGGDNDIVLDILKAGWQVGYFPSLHLKHIIPKERVQVKYMARLINNTNKSWIQLLENHRINPWKKIPVWTVPFRKLKAWFTYKPWRSKMNYIKWRGACGTFDGLSAIDHSRL